MDIAGWEKMYGSGERGSEDQPTHLLLDTAANLPPGTAIDLACGTGRNALFLAELGWRVTAIDGSETAIRTLRERAAARGLSVTTLVADLTNPDFALPDNAFDLIVVAYYLQRDLLQKIGPALRERGLALVIVHIPGPGEQPSYKRASRGELRSFFADSVRIVCRIPHCTQKYGKKPDKEPALIKLLPAEYKSKTQQV
jgi:SAM-dependent methyltransferase